MSFVVTRSRSACDPLDPEPGGLFIELILVSAFNNTVQSERDFMFLIRNVLHFHVDVCDHLVDFLSFSGVVDDRVPFQGITQLRDDFVQIPLPSR